MSALAIKWPREESIVTRWRKPDLTLMPLAADAHRQVPKSSSR
jgi:hypothetical protein